MCVILSGTGTDGGLGLKEINEAGGLVPAQWRGDGEGRWLAGRGRVFYDDGRPSRMFGVNYDITEGKKTAKALKPLDDPRVRRETSAETDLGESTTTDRSRRWRRATIR